MKLRFVCLGKTRNPSCRALVEDYCARLRHFTSVEWEERKSTYAEPDVLTSVQGKYATAPVVLLDAGGAEYTSEAFARWLAQQLNSGRSQLIFLLGGAEGFPAETKAKADRRLSLSKFTMPHELARVVLAEQLYRAFSLLQDHPYPK